MRGAVACLVGLMVAFTRVPSASADTRPRVAVLGLEVTSAVEVRTTELAHDLTEGMRARARLGSGPYAYAPSSERELIDEKMIKQCDTEALACMSEIGKELDADVLVYGKLEREDKIVRLTLHLLDVTKKSKINRTSVSVPLSATKEDVKTAARKAYEELAGASAAGGAGTVEVEANVPNGTVYVDDSSSEILANGKATLTLPEGRYRIAVESPGKQRKEITVTVKPEQVITQQFDLVEASAIVGGPQRSKVWKPAFIATGSLTAIFGLYWLYTASSWKGEIESIRASKPGLDSMGKPIEIDEGDCDGGKVRDGVDDKNGILEHLCLTRSRSIKSGIAAGIMLPFAIITGYMAFFHTPRGSAESSSPRMALTPVLTPSSAGASFEMRF
jgi:hypothetical protein